jgi:hypothetical protein
MTSCEMTRALLTLVALLTACALMAPAGAL